jgi:hypothetical protein
VWEGEGCDEELQKQVPITAIVIFNAHSNDEEKKVAKHSVFITILCCVCENLGTKGTTDKILFL